MWVIYKIEALSHDVKPAEWEKPFYKGTQTFTIKKDEVTSIDVIKCFLQNIMVTVDLNDDLKQKVGGDQSITIKVGTGELTFNNNDIGSGRAGFFEAAEVSNIIIVHFQGTVEWGMDRRANQFQQCERWRAPEHYV